MQKVKIPCGRCRNVILGLILFFISFACRDVSQSKDVQDPSPIAFANTGENNSLNIFLANEEGNIVKQLTFGEDRNFFPAWSPDGKSIAFTSDRGSEKSLIGVEVKDWTLVDLTEEMMDDPDFHKREILPMERGESQVWIMDADGSNQKQLTFEGRNAHPSWSPDGKTIAFSSTRTGLLEIFLMSFDGSFQRQLTSSVEENPGVFENLRQLELHFHGLYSPEVKTPINMFPTWSPDGKKIAFCAIKEKSYAIWVIDVDRGDLSRLTYPHGDRYPQANTPSWSPKGDKIAFWSGINLGPGAIWVMDPDGNNRMKVSNAPDNSTSDEPSWRPDGAKILYSTVRQDDINGFKSGIWMVNPDGTDNIPFVKDAIAGSNRASWRSVYSPQ